jgi:hypothetical protein
MRVTLMLADSAQVSEGKLFILGGGWSVTGPPAPSAIAMLVEVPWDQTNRRLEWRLELVDSDGYPVMTPDGEGGETAIVMGGEFEVGRSPLRVAVHDRRREPRRLAPGLLHPLRGSGTSRNAGRRTLDIWRYVGPRTGRTLVR